MQLSLEQSDKFMGAAAFAQCPRPLQRGGAHGLGMRLCSAVPSCLWRKPVMVAWSTPRAMCMS
jgi:benzoate membrane transport protein